METDYLTVTELAGSQVSQEQVDRLNHRYHWSAPFCRDKDVLEVACGTGQGLGYLSQIAKKVYASDVSEPMIQLARSYYQQKIPFIQFEGTDFPFSDRSLDVVLCHEAIYYLKDFEAFIQEAKRVLRPGGRVLIATANKDLYDFNPSPYSTNYYGICELNDLFIQHGFRVNFFGYTEVSSSGWKQKLLRPVKKALVKLGLFPKTAKGKLWMKRIIFGGLVQMPKEVKGDYESYKEPVPLNLSHPDREHKVIYCEASLN